MTEISEKTIECLLNLHSAASGEITLIRAGPSASPALREFLFARVPNGIYQPRCSAIHVLMALGANEILRDYLLTSPVATDPVERMGDEAVINAAARALSKVREPWVFDFLRDLAKHRISPGLVDALGAFDRKEAIPIFIASLGEDDAWIYGAHALQRLGTIAQDALIDAASAPQPSPSNESQSSVRKRRRSLEVLASAGTSLDHRWATLSKLIDDCDSRVAVLTCKIGLRMVAMREKEHLIRRLQQLREGADWVLVMDIDHCLEDYKK
jgi:hypothetical protein